MFGLLVNEIGVLNLNNAILHLDLRCPSNTCHTATATHNPVRIALDVLSVMASRTVRIIDAIHGTEEVISIQPDATPSCASATSQSIGATTTTTSTGASGSAASMVAAAPPQPTHTTAKQAITNEQLQLLCTEALASYQQQRHDGTVNAAHSDTPLNRIYQLTVPPSSLSEAQRCSLVDFATSCELPQLNHQHAAPSIDDQHAAQVIRILRNLATTPSMQWHIVKYVVIASTTPTPTCYTSMHIIDQGDYIEIFQSPIIR
jgi:hypothetical protein